MTPPSPLTLADGRAVAGAAGTPVWVEQRGAGSPAVFLAGLGDAHDAWGFQLEGPLAERHRLIAPDNRGAGRTPIPAEGITIAGMAEDAAAVLRGLGTGPAHVCGFSMGGAIAQELTLRHPALVRSLTLVNTYSHVDVHLQRLIETWIALAETGDAERFLQILLRWVYSDEAHEDGRVAEWLTDAAEHPHPMSGEALIAQCRACLEHDAADRIARIDVPVLVIAGAADPIFSPQHLHALATSIPGARIEWMPGLSHQPFQEDPDAFDAIVAAFWSAVEKAGA